MRRLAIGLAGQATVTVPAAWAEGITSCPVAIVISFGYPMTKESLHRGIARTPLSELVRYERW